MCPNTKLLSDGLSLLKPHMDGSEAEESVSDVKNVVVFSQIVSLKKVMF